MRSGAGRWRFALTLVALCLLALCLLNCMALGGCPLPEQHRYRCAYYVNNDRVSCPVYVCANSQAVAVSAAEAEFGATITATRGAPVCDYSITRAPPLHPEDVGAGGGDTCLSLGAGGDGDGAGGTFGVGGSPFGVGGSPFGVGGSPFGGGFAASSVGVTDGPSSSDVGAGAGSPLPPHGRGGAW